VDGEKVTKAERATRCEKCIAYLKRYRSIPEAQEAAARDGFSQNMSVWLSSLSRMLARGSKPGENR
jgi:hypothetical protein